MGFCPTYLVLRLCMHSCSCTHTSCTVNHYNTSPRFLHLVLALFPNARSVASLTRGPASSRAHAYPPLSHILLAPLTHNYIPTAAWDEASGYQCPPPTAPHPTCHCAWPGSYIDIWVWCICCAEAVPVDAAKLCICFTNTKVRESLKNRGHSSHLASLLGEECERTNSV